MAKKLKKGMFLRVKSVEQLTAEFGSPINGWIETIPCAIGRQMFTKAGQIVHIRSVVNEIVTRSNIEYRLERYLSDTLDSFDHKQQVKQNMLNLIGQNIYRIEIEEDNGEYDWTLPMFEIIDKSNSKYSIRAMKKKH